MLIKLRTDIGEIFSVIDLVLINKNIFSNSGDENEYSEINWKHDTESLLSELNGCGVTLQFFKRNSSECSFIRQNLNLIKQNRHILNAPETPPDFSVSSKYVIVTSDPADKELLKNSSFSVSSISSPLELRMASSYVSNLDGVDLFHEIGNIVLLARA